MKNYEYVLDIRTPFIKKLYDEKGDYKTELLTPNETLEELKKLQKENVDLEAKLAEADDCADRYWKQLGIVEEENNQLKQKLAEKEAEINDLKRDYIPKLEFGLQRANKMGKNLDVENEQLKQQLTEKEKEIEELKCKIDNQIKQLKESMKSE